MSSDFQFRHYRFWLVLSGFSLLLLISVLCALSYGSSQTSLKDVLAVLTGDPAADPTLKIIIRAIRLPRIILTAAAGATLSLGGVVFQALLKNPLAEPYILGISGGSAVGAIAGMMCGLALFPYVSIFAFLGGLGAALLVLGISWEITRMDREKLLLGGVMVNSFCGAGIMLMIFFSPGIQLQKMLFWMMGDLGMAKPEHLFLLFLLLPVFFVFFLLSRPLNLLTVGRETALSLGINERLITIILLVLTSLMVSLIVTQTGLIGFVGLVVPHTLRLILGADHHLLIPACGLGGATYLIFCDTMARTIPANGEMPVGIITAIIGAPIFIILLKKRTS